MTEQIATHFFPLLLIISPPLNSPCFIPTFKGRERKTVLHTYKAQFNDLQVLSCVTARKIAKIVPGE